MPASNDAFLLDEQERQNYPFQLRPGVWVYFTLPTALTKEDVARITAYLESLVLPEAREGQ